MDDRVSLEELNALAGAELHQAADAMESRAKREAGQPTEAGLRAAALLLRRRAERLGHVQPVLVAKDVGPEERARFEREVAQERPMPIFRGEVPPPVFMAPLPLGAWERLRTAVEAHVDFLRRVAKLEDADCLVADLGALAARLGPAATAELPWPRQEPWQRQPGACEVLQSQVVDACGLPRTTPPPSEVGRVLPAGTKPPRLCAGMVLMVAHHRLRLCRPTTHEGKPAWLCSSHLAGASREAWPTSLLTQAVLAESYGPLEVSVLRAGTKPDRLLPGMVLRHAHHKLTLFNESVDEHGLPCWWCSSDWPRQANAHWPTAWLEQDVLAADFTLPEGA